MTENSCPLRDWTIGAPFSVALIAVALSALCLGQPHAASAEEGTTSRTPVLRQPESRADGELSFAPAFTGCTVVYVSPTNWDFEQQVVELVNDHRASINRPPLKRVALLDAAARYHAQDMRDDNYISHDSKDRQGNSEIFVCYSWERIGSIYTGYGALAENIAAGQDSPQTVMNEWLASSGHRQNIENISLSEIGVGYMSGGAYAHYWVQNFGRRFNEFPLVIQREYSRTATPNVSIYIYGAWSQMRLRNDAGVWSAWQPFTNSLNWSLNWTQGVREVCAEVKSSSSNATVITCDTIELTTSGPSLSIQPAQMNFVYVLSNGQVFPNVASASLINPTNNQTLQWQRSTTPGWLNATPANGNSPSTIQLSLNSANAPTIPGLYQAVITYTATNASASTALQVSLSVVNSLPYRRFAPALRR